MTGATGAATGVTGAGPTGATGATGPTGPNDSRLRNFKIPTQFAKEPWAQEVKSLDDLWAKMSGAQKLIGKDKLVIPGDNATTEELNAFYTRLGRPENPEGYEFNNIEALKDVQRNVELDHAMKTIFFEEGVSKKVGERIVSRYEQLIYDKQKPVVEAAAQRDVDFQKLAKDVLGDDKDASISAFKTVLRESLGDKVHLAAKIENMSNEELLPLIVFSKNIHDKYTGENRVGIKPGDTPGLSGDLKSDYQTLSSQKIAIKTDTKIPEHIKKMKLANLNLQMQKIGVKAKEQGIDLFAH